MSTISQEPDATVQLQGVAWEDYLRLRELPDSQHVRMTFEEGILELVHVSKLRARIAELLGRLVLEWTMERAIPMQSCGAVTFKRQDLKKALEPDKCYYIRHESAVRDRDELDLKIDPPPELVIEVDVSARSRRRIAIYASLGVPEVWVWRREALQVLVLDERQSYVEQDQSRALPGFPLDEAQCLLAARQSADETTLVRQFRSAIRPDPPEPRP